MSCILPSIIIELQPSLCLLMTWSSDNHHYWIIEICTMDNCWLLIILTRFLNKNYQSDEIFRDKYLRDEPDDILTSSQDTRTTSLILSINSTLRMPYCSSEDSLCCTVVYSTGSVQCTVQLGVYLDISSEPSPAAEDVSMKNTKTGYAYTYQDHHEHGCVELSQNSDQHSAGSWIIQLKRNL